MNRRLQRTLQRVPWPAVPAIVWLTFFFIVPVAVVAWYSLGTRATGNVRPPVDLSHLTLNNLSTALNGEFASVMLATLRVAFTGTALCIVIALPVAYFLATRVPAKRRNILIAVIMVPFWTNFLIRTLAWRIVLGRRGVVSGALQDAGVIDLPLRLLDSRFAVQLGIVYNYLPLMVLPLFVALEQIDPRLREASRDLGVGRVRTFFGVTLPLGKAGLAAGSLLVFVPLAGDYLTASVLGGAQGTMAGSLVATQFFQAQNWPLGAAVAMVIMGSIVIATLIVWATATSLSAIGRRINRVIPTLNPPEAGSRTPTTQRATTRMTLPTWSATPFLAGWFVLTVLFLYTPVMFAIAHSFTSGKNFVIWDGASLQAFRDLWHNTGLRRSLWVSFRVSLAATVLSTTLGVGAGIALARRPGRLTRCLLVAIILVLITPEILFAVGSLLWFVELRGIFDSGYVRLVVSQSMIGLALVSLIVQSRLSGTDTSLEQAAADLGAPPRRVFRQITAPLLIPAIVAGTLLAFATSLDNTVTAQFVSTAGTSTFPTFVFGSLRLGVPPAAAAASTLIFALLLTALTVAALSTRRSGTGPLVSEMIGRREEGTDNASG